MFTLRVFESTKPVIGAINGPAVGVGATMTLPMDIRLASEDAKLGLVFARRGIVPEAASSWFLPRIVGISQAMEWVATGRVFSAQEARASGFPFTFEVVADPSINAFALPGGPMFIHTGLLKAVDNEAQLAGVMGHEMSHVILRHGTNKASKAQLIQLPALLAGQVAGGSMLGRLAQAGIGLGANSVLLKFSRGAESQADLMGSHLMAEGGYNPMQMARFFEKLNSQGGSRTLEFLSDHPNPGNRERAIEEEADRLPQRNYSFQTGAFDRMKQAVAQIHEPPPRRRE